MIETAERFYVNDMLPSLLARRSRALPSWLVAAYDGGDIVLQDGRLIVSGVAVNGGDWVVNVDGNVSVERAL